MKPLPPPMPATPPPSGSGSCPSCGKTLPSGVLAGLCPSCLLAQGLETEAGPGGGRRAEPPSVEVLGGLFPQLEIHELLGAGGMGAVYKARQPALDRWVALKVLPSGVVDSGSVASPERFNREARALARLSHPNIVAVHEFGQVEGWHYFLMEYVDGANLRQLVRSARLSAREVLQIVPQLCDALQYAHDQGVVHRDIKPENVLVDRRGRVRIADFGLAKIVGTDREAGRLTVEGQVMGTPHYMAPEQVERPETVDHRADIYSLGVVLYEMLTGDLPLGRFAPPSRKVEVDVRLDAVVLRALENDPERRYQKASEVKTGVQGAAEPSGAGGHSVPASEEAPVPADEGRNDWRVWLCFHSPEAAQVYRHMTRAEKGVDFWIQAGGAGLSLLVLVALAVVVQGMGGRPGPRHLVLLLSGIAAQGLLLWGAIAVLRRWLVSTQWARAHRIDPETFRLFALPPWLRAWTNQPGDRRRRSWFLIAAMIFGMVSTGIGLGLSALTRPSRVGPSVEALSRPVEPAPPAPSRAEPGPLPLAPWEGGGPRLRYLGWQLPNGRMDPARVWTAEGHPVESDADLAVLRQVTPGRVDVSRTAAAGRHPRFLHLWFEHPGFERDAEVELQLLDAEGRPVPLGADGTVSTGMRESTVGDASHGVGSRRQWATVTLAPMEGDAAPPRLDLVLRYVVGPLEKSQRVAVDFNGAMSLADGGQLSGLGEDAEGKAFIAMVQTLAEGVDRSPAAQGVLRDGSRVWPAGSMRGGSSGGATRLCRFTFDRPLRELDGFVVGTRPVRTEIWRGLTLPPLPARDPRGVEGAP